MELSTSAAVPSKESASTPPVTAHLVARVARSTISGYGESPSFGDRDTSRSDELVPYLERLFPLAGQSRFLVNAPAFGRSALRVDGGEFVVEASGHRETRVGADGIEETPPTQYVQAARLNGRPLETSYIRAADVHNGGVLHLELGPEPSPWGRSVRPPSLSDARPGGATA